MVDPIENNAFESPAIQYLRAKGVDFRLFQHELPIQSLQDAAKQRGETPDQVIRSLLFRLPQNEYVMVLASGPDQIDWKSLRQALGHSRMAMAGRDEVIQKTGYIPGTVTPFGIDTDISVLIDEDIDRLDEISLGSGVLGLAILMTPQALYAALGARTLIHLEKNPQDTPND